MCALVFLKQEEVSWIYKFIHVLFFKLCRPRFLPNPKDGSLYSFGGIGDQLEVRNGHEAMMLYSMD